MKKTDVEKAYQPYDLKLSPHRKKASDSSLFKEATQAVLAWHAKQAKAAAKAQADAAAEAAAASAAAGAANVISAAASYRPSAPSYAVTQPAPRRTTTTRKRVGGSGGSRLM